MHCDYPPGHEVTGFGNPVLIYAHHFGQDRAGRWHSWELTAEEQARSVHP